MPATIEQVINAHRPELVRRGRAPIQRRTPEIDSARKDAFLATLAHELRNPLSAIGAATAILQEQTHSAGGTMAVAVIARQAEHMSRLIADLLDMAGIVSGKLKLETQVFDLRVVVAQTAETRRGQIERGGHVLIVEAGEAPVWVDADPVRIAQVVSNLIDNAAKYTPECGQICVAVLSEGGNVILKVRDTGIGIPADQIQRIFQPFIQLHEPGCGAAGGLGLGLALVRSVTDLHRGDVSVASAGVGHGSCFTVRLPIARAVLAAGISH